MSCYHDGPTIPADTVWRGLIFRATLKDALHWQQQPEDHRRMYSARFLMMHDVDLEREDRVERVMQEFYLIGPRYERERLRAIRGLEAKFTHLLKAAKRGGGK